MERRGYTFVEMMVVLAIIALMMAIVVPRFAMSQKGEGLKKAATELSGALHTARRLAITNREVRALALDIYSIPAEFMIMRPSGSTWTQVEGTEAHRFTDENVAVVGVTTLTWPQVGSPPVSVLNITRTDDVLDPDPAHDPPGTDPLNGKEAPVSILDFEIYNPGNANSHVNAIYYLINFQPTGTADEAVIYLWNIEQGRQEIPAVIQAFGLSNIARLGVPPGLMIYNPSDQSQFFKLPTANSSMDSYYYTLVVNRITGAVEVYDYAWGTGSGSNSSWDRKKDG